MHVALRLAVLLLVGMAPFGLVLEEREPEGALRLPAYWSDGAVLQRNRDARLWGWAAPGSRVAIQASWASEEHSCQADSSGVFRLRLAPPQEVGPHRLELRAGDEALALSDLYFGEVWLCAGQSNMEMPVSAVVPPGSPRLAEAELPKLRVFDVENAFLPAPSDECRGRWRVSSPKSAMTFSAVAVFFGRRLVEELEVPVGLVTATWGGTIGEAWTSGEALAPFPECSEALETLAHLAEQSEESWTPWLNPNRPSALYNGMIAPLAPDTDRALQIRGVVWYQGESNRGRARRYGELFPALIRDWRRALALSELPFLFVQIAPFAYLGDRGEAARLRDEQRRALSVPNTGMAVTMDIGDPGNLHPTRKLEVGERLARWALSGVYGRSELVPSGPLFRGWKPELGGMRLFFDHATGLTTTGEVLEHFTLAGSDGVFHPAQARIDGETVIVRTDEVQDPREVRFGGGAADETDLSNAAGLPAASFIGDERDRL